MNERMIPQSFVLLLKFLFPFCGRRKYRVMLYWKKNKASHNPQDAWKLLEEFSFLLSKKNKFFFLFFLISCWWRSDVSSKAKNKFKYSNVCISFISRKEVKPLFNVQNLSNMLEWKLKGTSWKCIKKLTKNCLRNFFNQVSRNLSNNMPNNLPQWNCPLFESKSNW